jgi:hypothetical protein
VSQFCPQQRLVGGAEALGAGDQALGGIEPGVAQELPHGLIERGIAGDGSAGRLDFLGHRCCGRCCGRQIGWDHRGRITPAQAGGDRRGVWQGRVPAQPHR